MADTWRGADTFYVLERQITIHFDNELMNSIWFIIFSGYFSLESGFFIYYDRTAAGDDCDDDDDDEESAGDE